MLTEAFKFKKWADVRTLDAIKKIDIGSFTETYDFVRQQLNHMVIVEELFSCRLMNKPAGHEQTNTRIVPSLDVLQNRLLASDDWFIDYAISVSSSQSSSASSSVNKINEVVSFTFVDEQQGRMRVEEILLHIITHGSYHRGNIAHALDLAHVLHPVDGYGAFIHEREPERRGVLPE